jgi:hypothetical protein
LCQLNSAHIFSSCYFSTVHFNIILLSMSMCPKGHSHKIYQYLIFVSCLFYACCMFRLYYPPWSYHFNNIWWRLQIVMLLIIQFFQPPVTSALLDLSIFLSTLSSDTPSLFSSLPRMYGTRVHELPFLPHLSWKSNNNIWPWLKLTRIRLTSKQTRRIELWRVLHFCLHHVQSGQGPTNLLSKRYCGFFSPVL